MIRERKSQATITLGNGDKETVPGYRCIATDENGRLTRAFFRHTRADEYLHAQFVETHRSMRNGKPFRTKAQKELARARAIKVNGAWCSPAGRNFHEDDNRKKAA